MVNDKSSLCLYNSFLTSQLVAADITCTIFRAKEAGLMGEKTLSVIIGLPEVLAVKGGNAGDRCRQEIVADVF